MSGTPVIHVLLTEDLPLAATGACMMLEMHGCQVKWVETGKAALTALQNQEAGYYRFLLLDIGLPDIDGYTVCETIRQWHNEHAKLPVIALSAHDHPEDHERALVSGMNHFIRKPLTVEDCAWLLENFANTPAA